MICKIATVVAILDLRSIFDLQVTEILPTKFQVDWYIGSGEKVQNKFSRLPP